MKLSIITVTFNALSDLRLTISSLVDHPSDSFELVVVDGGSTDGTREFLRSLNSSRVRFVSEPDAGIYNAMNKGVAMSRGEFVYFLNAGDELTSLSALSKVIDCLNDADVYYCDIYLQHENKICLRKYMSTLNLTFWLREYMCHQAVFFRRQLFNELGPHQEQYRFSADYDFLLHAWKKRKRFEHIDIAIAIYDMHGTSAQPKNFDRVFGEYAQIQKCRLNLYERLYCFLLRAANDVTPKTAPFRFKLKRKIVRKMLRPFFGWKAGFEFFFGDTALPTPRGLRVMHVNTYSSHGGAAIASMRLHQALLANGVQSQYVCLVNHVEDSTLINMAHKTGWALRMQNFIGRIEGVTLKVLGLKRSGLLSSGLTSNLDWARFQKFIDQFDPDVIHLHWVNHGFLRVKDIPRFKKPIVWTFHDMWAFLGLEHCSLDQRQIEGFANSGKFYALDRFVWKQKLRQWQPMSTTLTPICPSQWMRDRAAQSSIWRDHKIHVIGNSVPIDKFSPVEKRMAREVLGISTDIEHILLFGAASPFREPVKRFDHFIQGLENFLIGKSRARVLVITFGSAGGKYMVPGVQHKHFDFIHSHEFLRIVYSAADILVVSSEIESFCLVAAEAQACGTPVACYDTAGLRDVVVHQKTGFRADLSCPESLGYAMNWIREDKARYCALVKNAREFAVANFEAGRVAKEHLKLYRSLQSSETSQAHGNAEGVLSAMVPDRPNRIVNADSPAERVSVL